MEQASEAAAAAAGGVFSAGALFPLEVIKTNLQAKTKRKKPPSSSPPPAEDEERGVPGEHTTRPSLAEEDGGAGGKEPQPQRQQQQQQRRLVMLARQNLERRREEEAHSVASVAKDIFSREGMAGFYRGMWYAAGQSGVEKAAYFYGYGWLRALALRGGGGRGGLSTAMDLGLGYLAEAFHLPFTIPIEVVLTKIMTSKEKTNAFAVMQGILSESGPAGFYTGIQAYAVLCLKPAIQYAVFNRLKAVTLAYRGGVKGGGLGEPKELTAVQAFVIGAISRAVATVVVFPYIRAKVIIMSRKTGDESSSGSSEASASILASLVTILKDEGASALFQGIAPEIGRGVLSAALMLMVKEKIHSAVKGAIVGGRTTTS